MNSLIGRLCGILTLSGRMTLSIANEVNESNPTISSSKYVKSHIPLKISVKNLHIIFLEGNRYHLKKLRFNILSLSYILGLELFKNRPLVAKT